MKSRKIDFSEDLAENEYLDAYEMAEDPVNNLGSHQQDSDMLQIMGTASKKSRMQSKVISEYQMMSNRSGKQQS